MELEATNSLCCCEYVDRDQERNHILACLCNCVDLDLAFDSCVQCKSVATTNQSNMLLTFQDRLRIPWIGGAKRISLDSVTPIILLPGILLLAAINIIFSVVMFAVMGFVLVYSYNRLMKTNSSTRFFYFWLICSIVFLIILFEEFVPFIGILPEENFALMAITTMSLFCFYRTRKYSSLNQTNQLTENNDEIVRLTVESETVEGSNHCSKCRLSGMVKRDHHNIWLACCINHSNQRYFLFGCIFGILALLFGAQLTLTSICHPFFIGDLFGYVISLPDDCDDVYMLYEYGLCFVSAIYALLMAIVTMLTILQQIYVISRGLTTEEWRRGKVSKSSGCLRNWKSRICCCY